MSLRYAGLSNLLIMFGETNLKTAYSVLQSHSTVLQYPNTADMRITDTENPPPAWIFNSGFGYTCENKREQLFTERG
jgi:hypothetical protein